MTIGDPKSAAVPEEMWLHGVHGLEPQWIEADPARDPKVQAKVLRAVAAHMARIGARHSINPDWISFFADAIEKGEAALAVGDHVR